MLRMIMLGRYDIGDKVSIAYSVCDNAHIL
jgi:hypothetical protein